MTTDVSEKVVRLQRKLDLGAGSQKPISDEWVSLDIVSTFRPDVLGSAYHLPFADESLKAVKCHHVLEHIPRDYFVFHWEPKTDEVPGDASYLNGYTIPAGSRSYIEARNGLVDVVNEMWRILEVGGRAWVEVPVFPSELAIADPTHGSFLTTETFSYFKKCVPPEHNDSHDHATVCHEDHRLIYGISPWKILTLEKLNYGRVCSVLMEKVLE